MVKKTPDNILRDFQLKGWQKYSPEVQTWIMMTNFFFAVIPAIVFLVRNVFIQDEVVMMKASLKNTGYWTSLIIYFLGLMQSVFQLVYYKRFMSMNLVKTFFVGQCMGVILLLLGMSESFIDFLQNIVNPNEIDSFWKSTSKKLGLFSLILTFAYVFFFVYRFSPFSEAKSI